MPRLSSKNDGRSPLAKTSLEYDKDDDVLKKGEEIESLFSQQYVVEAEVSASMESLYVLHVCGSRLPNTKVAAAFSDYSCILYDLHQLTKLDKKIEHDAAITGLRFDPEHCDILYSSSLDGTIRLYDLRTRVSNCIKEFKGEDGEPVTRPLTCFDVSCNGKFLCAGTELVDGDAFLLFWDVRADKVLGGYWECHTDDVTQVLFSNKEQDKMASSSTDGLINVFDISESCEDDALTYTLNTDCSVAKIGWWKANSDDVESGISCISDMEELQLWELDGASPHTRFTIDDIANSLRRRCSGNCYLVDAYQSTQSDDLTILAGSSAEPGKYLRSLHVSGNSLVPNARFADNKQIVRTCWHLDDNVLVTGGEGGIISVWKSKDFLEKSSNTKIKAKSKHSKLIKPY